MGISLLLRVFSHKNGKTHTWFFSQWLKQQPEKTISLYLQTEKKSLLSLIFGTLAPCFVFCPDFSSDQVSSWSRSAQLRSSFNPPLSHTHRYHLYFKGSPGKHRAYFKRESHRCNPGILKHQLKSRKKKLCDCKHMGGITIETS